MKHTEGKAEIQSRLSEKFFNKEDEIRYKERIFLDHGSGNYVDVVSIKKAKTKANAERIVKAWNNLDDLTSALQDMTGLIASLKLLGATTGTGKYENEQFNNALKVLENLKSAE